VFGNDAPVQRCVQHKQRNVLDHLPERDRDTKVSATRPIRRRWMRSWR
jgi:putative transposase